MNHPWAILFLMVVAITPLVKVSAWSAGKYFDALKTNKKTLACPYFYGAILAAVITTACVFLALTAVTKITADFNKQENPFLTKMLDTVDRLARKETVSLKDARDALNMGVYPTVDEWCKRRGVKEDDRNYVIRTLSERIMQATVTIDDVPDDIAAYAKPAATITSN